MAVSAGSESTITSTTSDEFKMANNNVIYTMRWSIRPQSIAFRSSEDTNHQCRRLQWGMSGDAAIPNVGDELLHRERWMVGWMDGWMSVRIRRSLGVIAAKKVGQSNKTAREIVANP